MRRVAFAVVLLLACGGLAGCLGPDGGGGGGDGATQEGGVGPGGGAEGSDRCGPRPNQERIGKDWSKETLGFALDADGDFGVDLPLPVSEDGTQPDDWLANVQVPDGWTAMLQATTDGQVLRVRGSGSGTVASCSIQPQAGVGNGCCAEQFLDARWTGTDRPRHELTSLPVEVADGTVSIDVGYTAVSNWCGADAAFAGSASGPGRHELPGEHSAWCS